MFTSELRQLAPLIRSNAEMSAEGCVCHVATYWEDGLLDYYKEQVPPELEKQVDEMCEDMLRAARRRLLACQWETEEAVLRLPPRPPEEKAAAAAEAFRPAAVDPDESLSPARERPWKTRRRSSKGPQEMSSEQRALQEELEEQQQNLAKVRAANQKLRVETDLLERFVTFAEANTDRLAQWEKAKAPLEALGADVRQLTAAAEALAAAPPVERRRARPWYAPSPGGVDLIAEAELEYAVARSLCRIAVTDSVLQSY